MSTIAVTVPESLRARVEVVAEKERVSVDQLIAVAIAEKLSALDTEDYLVARAKRASRERFEEALAEIPDVEPDEWDRL